ncbi:MAG: hypothetical protein EA419_02750 [Wenzhouxiangella sp.]|nr:MAG: hypothetical protein EA419_02750 [Wenzhouxiangella sp.]
MNQMTSTLRLCTLSAAVMAAFALGVDDAQAHRDHGGPLHQDQSCETWLDGRPERNVPPRCRALASQLNQVRRATSAFFSFDVAVAAGWDAFISPCVESPMGGMGYHLANIEQLGNGIVSLLRPEVLLYAPTEDGSMEFLGVEYIVPAPLWASSEPPEIMGQSFHFNPGQNIWALHVWIGKPNPAGVFADWNPEVSCEFAPPPAPPSAD